MNEFQSSELISKTLENGDVPTRLLFEQILKDEDAHFFQFNDFFTKQKK